jgi:hypothetical protein
MAQRNDCKGENMRGKETSIPTKYTPDPQHVHATK